MEHIIINLRGTIFMTDPNILKNVTSGSPLRSLTSDSVHYIPTRDEYFFNRNPAIFHHVLDYCMSGKLHIPSHLCAENVREELNFWGVPKGILEKCCWKSFYQNKEDMHILNKLLNSLPSSDENIHLESDSSFRTRNTDDGVKTRLRKFLNDPPTSRKAKIWCGVVYLTIITSMVTSILFGFRDFRRDLDPVIEYPHEKLEPTDTMMFYWNTTPVEGLLWTDAAANTILLIEWIMRLLTCHSITQFFCILYNVTDVVAFIGTGVGLIFELDNRQMLQLAGSYEAAVAVGICYAARIFRIFRLLKHSVGMNLLLLSLRSSIRELLVLALSLVSISFMFGVVIMFAEMTSHTTSITDIVKGVWWAIITMTTVGYGDMHPTNEVGYFIGGLCAIAGILLIALPVAVTSSNFYDFFTFNKYRIWFKQDQNEEQLLRNKRRSISKKSLFSKKKSFCESTACETATDNII